MIKKIKTFLNELANDNQDSSTNTLSIEMASTVLLCEVMRADGKLDENEMKQL